MTDRIEVPPLAGDPLAQVGHVVADRVTLRWCAIEVRHDGELVDTVEAAPGTDVAAEVRARLAACGLPVDAGLPCESCGGNGYEASGHRGEEPACRACRGTGEQ